MFHGHLDYLQKPPLGGRPNTNPGDHGTPNAHNRWFILFYHAWGPAWIEILWNNIWLRAWSHMTPHSTWKSVTTPHEVGGVLEQAFGHFLLGSHNFMVSALGSCVKWPLSYIDLDRRVCPYNSTFELPNGLHENRWIAGHFLNHYYIPTTSPYIKLKTLSSSTSSSLARRPKIIKRG